MKTLWEDKKVYEEFVKAMEEEGFKVLSKWRKGMKSIRLGDLVVSERKQIEYIVGIDSRVVEKINEIIDEIT